MLKERWPNASNVTAPNFSSNSCKFAGWGCYEPSCCHEILQFPSWSCSSRVSTNGLLWAGIFTFSFPFITHNMEWVFSHNWSHTICKHGWKWVLLSSFLDKKPNYSLLSRFSIFHLGDNFNICLAFFWWYIV